MKLPSTSLQLVTEIRSAALSADDSNIGALVPSLVAALLVVLGWRVLERFARERERRGDLREAVKIFREVVDEVTVAAASFYQLPGDSPAAITVARTIRAKIGVLPDYLDTIRGAGMVLTTDDALRMFRQAVTGGEFDSFTRRPQPAGAPSGDSIVMAGQHLSRAVQTELFRFLLTTRSQPWLTWKNFPRSARNGRTSSPRVRQL